MGEFRLAVVSASDRRQNMVDFLRAAGRSCAPKAYAKEDLQLSEFSRQPDAFHAFLNAVMEDAEMDDAA